MPYKRLFPIPPPIPFKIAGIHVTCPHWSIRPIKNMTRFYFTSFFFQWFPFLFVDLSFFFLSVFLAGDVCSLCILCFSLSKEVFISLSLLKGDFTGYRILGWWCILLFFQQLKYFTLFSSCWHGFWQKGHCNYYPCSSSIAPSFC